MSRNAIDNQVDNERILADVTLHRPVDHKVCSEGTVNTPESQNGKSNSENDISSPIFSDNESGEHNQNMPDLAKDTTTTEENFAECFSENETTNHELTSSYIQFARVDDIIFADTATNQIDLHYVDLPSNAAQHKKLPASDEVGDLSD